MTSIPDFRLSVGIPLAVEKVCLKISGLEKSRVISLLKIAARKHKNLFGSEIFRLQYELQADSLMIIPGPVIGKVDCEEFSLTFEPKFEGISVGKCLAFAHLCQAAELVNQDGNVVDDEVSDDCLTSSLDYFSKAFVAAVFSIFQTGILESRKSYSCKDSELKGEINFGESIAKASEFPIVNTQKPSIDLPVNRYLKSTLRKVIETASSDELKGLAGQALNLFTDASDQDVEYENVDLNISTTLRRTDYEKALLLAEIIQTGYRFENGSELSFSPFFTINLDILFEKLVEFSIKNKVSDENFFVSSQVELKHPANPELKGKCIKPDVILSAKNNPRYKNVVIDCKNKYSLSGNSELSISNADIYQMIYYAQCFETKFAVLVYPGNAENRTTYPIEGSEGRASYRKKRAKAIDRILKTSYSRLRFESHDIHLFFWRVDLTGTMRDTELSFTQLALFLTDLSKNKLI